MGRIGRMGWPRRSAALQKFRERGGDGFTAEAQRTRRDGPGNSRAKRQFITAGGRSKNGRGQVRGGQSGALQKFRERGGYGFTAEPPSLKLRSPRAQSLLRLSYEGRGTRRG